MKHRAGRGVRANVLAGLSMPARVVVAMARGRVEFKNKVEEHLRGALGEYLKAVLAERNGHLEWVAHWQTETKNLLERNLHAALRHGIRGFKNRRLAFDEVAAIVQADEEAYRRWARKVVMRDARVSSLMADFVPADSTFFWQWVAAVTADALSD